MDALSATEANALLTRKDGRVYIVAFVDRAAVLSFVAAVEWYWYAPGTERNRLFDIYSCQWERAAFFIVAFPDGRLQAAMRLAGQLGLRLAQGVPAMLGDAGSVIQAMITGRASRRKEVPMRLFPGAEMPDGSDNQMVYTVEYDTKHPLFKNRKDHEATMRAADAEVNKMLNKGMRLTPVQMADYIFGTGPFPNVQE